MTKKRVLIGCLCAVASITAFSIGNALYGSALEHAQAASSDTAAQLPYEKSFKSNLTGWYAIDANYDGYTWTQDQFGTRTYAMDAASTSDDYLVSPEFAFTAGHSYKVTLTFEIWGSPYATDHFALYRGNGEESMGFTKVQDINLSTSTLKDEITFKAVENTTERIAIHSNVGYYSNWYVTSVKVESLGIVEDAPKALIDADFTQDTELKTGWTTIDGNNDGNTWHIEEGLQGVSLTRAAKTSHNDWLVTPAVELEAGATYLVSYSMTAAGGFDNEEASIYAGAGNTTQELTLKLTEESLEDGKTANTSVRFTPTTSGVHHFGIHGTSPARNGNLTLTYFKVEESKGVRPNTPTDLAVEASIRNKNVTLSWKNPSVDTENVSIAGVVKTNIYMNNNLVATIPGAAGAEMSYIHTPTSYQGKATYRIECFCEDGLYSSSIEHTVSLDDFEGEIKSLKSWGGQGNDSFANWTLCDIDGYQTFQQQSWDNSMLLYYRKERDDWAISPAIEMHSKRRYIVSFTVQTSVSWGSQFEITLGTNDEVESHTTTVIPSFAAIGNGAITYKSSQFSVAQDGNFHLGIHCTSTETMTTIKNIEILYFENGNDATPLPYVESFDSTEALSGWTFSPSTTFAVAQSALSSTASPRDEYFFTPSFEMHNKFGYEVDVNYQGSEGFSMAVAQGQSGQEYEAAQKVALNDKGNISFIYYPQATATYCIGFQSKNNDAALNSINNLSVGKRIYTTLPFIEDFTSHAVNTSVYPWENSTAIAAEDCSDLKAMKFVGTTTSPWVNHTLLVETLQASFTVKKGNAPLTVKALYNNGTTATLATITEGANNWTLHNLAINYPGNDAFAVAIQFESTDDVLIDNFSIDFAPREIYVSEPTNLQVAYSSYNQRTTVSWLFPTHETSGIELTRNPRVNIYRNETLIGYATGEPGSLGSISLDHVWDFHNGAMVFRAESQMGDILGKSVTKVQYDESVVYTAPVMKLPLNNGWSTTGSWTINEDGAFSTTSVGSLTSSNFTIDTNDMEHIVKYSMAGDANAPFDMTVKMLNSNNEVVGSGSFTNCYLGKENGAYPTFTMKTDVLSAGQYHIVFDITSCTKVDIKDVEIFEIHTYPESVDIEYFNDFEDAAISNGRIAPNWNIYSTNNASYWAYRPVTGAPSGNRALVAPNTQALREDLVYTPYIKFEKNQTYILEFSYRIEGANSQINLIAANYATSSDFSVYETFSGATDGWAKYQLELAAQDSFECLFGFFAISTQRNDGYVAIDDFKVYKKSSTVEAVGNNIEVTIANNTLMCNSTMNQVVVVDLQGRTVKVASQCNTIDLSTLTSGVYVARIVDENGNSRSLKIRL